MVNILKCSMGAGAVLLLAVTGCSGDSAGSSGGSDVQVALDELYTTTLSVCDCAETAADQAECRAETDQASFTANSCEVDALSTAEGQQTVTCVTNVASAFSSCVEDASCGSSALDACLSSFLDGLAGCEPSESVSAALEACDSDLLGGGDSAGNFACDDGTSIPADWVCDGEADCVAGEDEVGC